MRQAVDNEECSDEKIQGLIHLMTGNLIWGRLVLGRTVMKKSNIINVSVILEIQSQKADREGIMDKSKWTFSDPQVVKLES